MKTSVRFTATDTLVDGKPSPVTKETLGHAIKQVLGMNAKG